MSGIEKIIEEQIQNAIQNGDLDNLKGSGKPLDLSVNYGPDEVAMGNRILKNADFVPPEVELMNQIALLKEQYREAVENDSTNLDNLRIELVKKQSELAVRMEAIERYTR